MRRLLPFLVVAVWILLAVPAGADWDPGQPAKWVQLPDLSPMGIDVNATEPYILADDFLCMETGPITDIHVWGSWYMDMVDPAPTFILSIHADIPASESPTGYSMPGQVLWYRVFQPGEYVARVYAENIDEGWMDPPDYYIFPGDHVCWQYNFFIDPADAFYQEGNAAEPMVYWLDVQAIVSGPGAYLFGWKTTLDHWNDDAVWGQGMEPFLGPWYELIYPPMHEMAGQSIDLAFAITTTTEEELDWGDAPDPNYPTYAASNGANHVIVPGVFLGAGVDPETDGQPDATATGDDLDGNDDEDGVFWNALLMPGLPSSFDVVTSAPGFIDAWIDFGNDGSWAQPIDQIAAGVWVPAGTTTIPFLVPPMAIVGPTFARVRFNTAGPLPFTGAASDGEVEDYKVWIEEPVDYKWIQMPDLDTTGIDVNATEPYVLADDFLCQMPAWITEITIWGSWLDDYLPFGVDPMAVDFTLSFHSDIPDSVSPNGYSMPGEPLWFMVFPAGSFIAEPYQEGIEEGWLDPPTQYSFPADWTCWRYRFFVPIGEAFHQMGRPDSNVVYWLDVQARPLDQEARFGWKTSIEHWNDDAVWGQGIEPYFGPWNELRYPFGHPYHPESIDLAFALRHEIDTGVGTDEAPATFRLGRNVPNPFNPITTIHYDVPAGGGAATIEVFDVSGRLVRTLVDGQSAAGSHQVVWDGRNARGRSVPSGVYFYRLTAPGVEMTRKMVLLR
ncbi:MAG: T9SS type A sorting domain-containing protein [Candidatus Eisenbacteria bacterium]|nr:T9SS type A sorting domain-containing protein [Candidatus Eisenbacteria bacterium]